MATKVFNTEILIFSSKLRRYGKVAAVGKINILKQYAYEQKEKPL